MFAYLKGILQSFSEGAAVVNVRDVGYAVMLPLSYATKMHVGEECALHVSTTVREDSITLYGFLTQEEKQWFHLLVDVQGVGGKLALCVLSHLTCAELFLAIKQKDSAALEQVSGLGGRIAERLVRELHRKVLKRFPDVPEDPMFTRLSDVYKALEGLGYKQKEVRAVCEEVVSARKNASSEELIYDILQRLGSA